MIKNEKQLREIIKKLNPEIIAVSFKGEQVHATFYNKELPSYRRTQKHYIGNKHIMAQAELIKENCLPCYK